MVLSATTLYPASTSAVYGGLPVVFEPNQGQTDREVKFLSRGQGYAIYLTQDGAVLDLRTAADGNEVRGAAVRVRFAGARRDVTLDGIEPLPGKSSYFIGQDRSQWRAGIPQYGKVRYANVYPGIDTVFYGTGRQFEYDFIVAPGADPSRILLAIEGADGLRLDVEGNLLLATGAGELKQLKPVIYQGSGAARRSVDGRYRIVGRNRVAFEVAAYDADEALVIDPVLHYSTLLGGAASDVANGIAVDAAGNAYITGTTSSTNFPTVTGSYRSTVVSGQSSEAFVAKLSPDGSSLLYSTYLGGSSSDTGLRIAVDSSGNAYVSGDTQSSNFPTTAGALNTSGYGFVTKLNSTGTQLVYSTYLFNIGLSIFGMAVDGFGNVGLTGYAYNGAPTTAGVVQPANRGSADAYILKLNSTGSALVFATYFGGTEYDAGRAIATDTDGNIYVAGMTRSSDFPTSIGALQRITQGDHVFVAKVNSSGTAVLYSTYLPVSGNNLFDVLPTAVNGGGEAFVAGQVSGVVSTTPGAFNSSGAPGFISRLSADGSTLVYSTYFNAPVKSLALDADDNAYVAGSGTVITTPGALQPAGGSTYFAKLDSAGGTLLYSSYFGASGDQLTGMALGANGAVYLTGSSTASSYPTTIGAVQTANAGASDAFVARIDMSAGSCSYQLTPASQGFEYSGNTGTFTVTAPAGCPWTVASSQTWVTITSGNSGNGNGTVNFSVAANDSTQSRAATINVGGQAFSISQGGAPCTYTLQPASRSFTATGGVSSFTVNTPYGCPWTPVSGVGWVSLTSTYGYGPGSVWFTVAENTGAARSGSVSVAGQSFLVSQAGAGVSCTYSLSATSKTFGASGGDGSVDLTATAGCPWTAWSNVSWITITSGASGSGSGSVGFRVAANTTGAQRTGTVMIDGQVLTTFQTHIQTSVGPYRPAVFRAGSWYIDLNGNAGWDGPATDRVRSFGLPGDIPVMGDWDGTGAVKMGVFRGGTWHLDLNGNGAWDGPTTDRMGSFGLPGDIPVVGDWTGSGSTKVGVFRSGQWHLDLSGTAQWSSSTVRVGSFGLPGDMPVVGDWNGSGTTKVGVFRAGLWYLDLSGTAQWSAATTRTGNFGVLGDIPLVGDWTGSGTTKVGIYRNGVWHLDLSGTAQWSAATDRTGSFGLPGDIPVVGDWDGSGSTKVGVFRNGTWCLDMNGNAQWDGTSVERVGSFGFPGDLPVVARWN